VGGPPLITHNCLRSFERLQLYPSDPIDEAMVLEVTLGDIKDCAHLQTTLAEQFGVDSSDLTLLYFDADFGHFAQLRSLEALPSSEGRLQLLFEAPGHRDHLGVQLRPPEGTDETALRQLRTQLAELSELHQELIVAVEAELAGRDRDESSHHTDDSGEDGETAATTATVCVAAEI
jgi:hypothetical protein